MINIGFMSMLTSRLVSYTLTRKQSKTIVNSLNLFTQLLVIIMLVSQLLKSHTKVSV